MPYEKKMFLAFLKNVNKQKRKKLNQCVQDYVMHTKNKIWHANFFLKGFFFEYYKIRLAVEKKYD